MIEASEKTELVKVGTLCDLQKTNFLKNKKKVPNLQSVSGLRST